MIVAVDGAIIDNRQLFSAFAHNWSLVMVFVDADLHIRCSFASIHVLGRPVVALFSPRHYRLAGRMVNRYDLFDLSVDLGAVLVCFQIVC
jgi:hypothetical protein